MPVCRGLEESGADQGIRWDHLQALLNSTWTGLPERERLSRGLWWGSHHPEEVEGVGGGSERGLKCLGDAAQQHDDRRST